MSPFAPWNSFSRDRFGHPVPCQPADCPHPGFSLVLTYGMPLTLHGGVHLSIPSPVIGYRWRSPPRSRRRRASSPQSSSSNGCAFSGITMDELFVRLTFPTPTIDTTAYIVRYREKSIGGATISRRDTNIGDMNMHIETRSIRSCVSYMSYTTYRYTTYFPHIVLVRCDCAC